MKHLFKKRLTRGFRPKGGTLLQARTILLLSLFAPASLLAAAAAPTGHGKKSNGAATGATTAKKADTFSKDVLPLVRQYCGGCHGVKEGSAGISLLGFHSTADVLKSRDEWDRVAENIRNGHMPPAGMPAPTDAQRKAMSAWIESTLSNAECDVHDPGHITMRRLNRDEYNNTIRDLTGLDLHPADAFPNDDVGYGFDNIGDVLSMSPILLEKYLNAAEKISEAAIVTPEMMRRPVTISASNFTNKGAVGTAREGGKRLDGTGSEIYSDQQLLGGGVVGITVNAGEQALGNDHCRMTLKMDDRPVNTIIVAAPRSKPYDYDFTVNTTPGTHRISLVYENGFSIPANAEKKTKEKVRWLIVNSVKITRPQDGPVALPASNRRIVFVSPKSPAENDACARQVLTAFARRAYRRPVAAAEMDRLLRYVGQATKAGASWERGIQLGVQAILVSPNFLFRVETDPLVKTAKASAASHSAQAHPISDYEMASRLSYFLWSSMPDETLLKLAAQGELQKPAALAAQVKRMLRDPKAHTLADNFAGQWLQLRKLANVSPDTARFPDFNDNLRNAMKTETELFFESIVKEDRSVLDFLDAKYTFLNEPLARHYGIEGVSGNDFRRVALTGDQRGGILTQASVLTVTSNPTRTSPVKRGKWVLDNIFNTPPPPAPPNVPKLADEAAKGPLVGTLRQRMEQHRKDPTCASCHARMDPIGFGLENFDATGGWRTKDGDYPVDSSGVLYGQKFSTPSELKTILLSKKKQFVRCLTEKMLIYGLGRGIEPNDRCNVDAMVNRIIQNDYRFSALVTTVVQSAPFRTRRGDGGTQ